MLLLQSLTVAEFDNLINGVQVINLCYLTDHQNFATSIPLVPFNFYS